MSSPAPDNQEQPIKSMLESGERANVPPIRDNKNYVTPYAFAVSPEIYGKPLAGPGKRGLAMLVDLALILLLTYLSDFMLFGFIGWTLLAAGRQLNKRQGYRVTRAVLKVTGGLCAFIFIVGLWEAIFDDSSVNGPEYGATQVIDEDVSNPATLQVPELLELEEVPELSSAEVPNLWQQISDALPSFGINFGWAAFYFSVITGWFSGQTIGKKLCGIKVIKLDGSDLNLWDAFGRYGGYTAGFATGLMGFIQVYWDPNRQAIQDKISGTLVVVKDAPKVCIETELP